MCSKGIGALAAATVVLCAAGVEADRIKREPRSPGVASKVTATVVDLTQASAGNPDAGEANGARFFTNNQRPTGTGVIEPFLRLQRKGVERGFNTDARQILDNVDGIWTHSLRLSDVPVVQLDGRSYLEFLLDINEDSGADHELLSLNIMELYLADAGDIEDLTRLRAEKQVYNLDSSGQVTIALKYNPDHGVGTGSGSGDMYAYVPVWTDYSTTSGPQYLYLYSLFGDPDGASAGFEEWAVVAHATVVPLPRSAWAGLGLLTVLGGLRLRRHYRDA